MKRPAGLPRCDDFRALGNGYSRFRWYSLAGQDHPLEFVVTLAPTNWRRASKLTVVLATGWSAFITAALVLKPQPLNAGSIARHLGIAHCSVNAIRGSLVERE